MDNDLRMQKSLAHIEQHLDEISYSLKELVKVLKKIEQKSTTIKTEEEQENEGRD